MCGPLPNCQFFSLQDIAEKGHLLANQTIKLGNFVFPYRPVPLLRPRLTAIIADFYKYGFA
jgi:hypothetical protein